MPTSFVADFVEYMSGTECPPIFNVWTAYGLLSAAIGRKVYCDIDYFFVRCDTYILLVGRSGAKKTAAMLLGLDILREAVPDVVLSGDNETYQGIITWMHNDNSSRTYLDEDGKTIEYKPYHIFAEELMDYLQLNPIAMVTFLTSIYGKKGYQYKLKNEEHTLINPYVTMFGCTTPEWLTDQVKSKNFAEGYGRRTIIVCCSDILRRKPVLTPTMSAARQRCVVRLVQLSKLAGPVKLDRDAHDHFWNFYVSQRDPDDRFLQNWYSTRHLNTLKIAMLSSVAERDDLVVTLNHVKLAIGLIEEVESKLGMVTERIGRDETIDSSLQVLNILRNNKGTMSEKLLKLKTRKDFKDPVEQFRTMQFLAQTGQIVVADEATNGVKMRVVRLLKGEI